jgi:hypothetical protein
MYRTRFSGEFGRHLRFESPIARQLFVPIRIGESVTIEASTKKGVVLFRSKVIDRVETTHELIVEKPSVISQFDRRDCRRFVCDDLEVAAKVDGVSVQLMDVSEKGAKVRMIGEFEKGERISVRLPWLEGEVGAWVIDSEKVGRGEDTGLIVRMVFEEPVKLPRRVSLA